ncbi:GTPase family protein [Thermobispora bispora]|uniref:Putative ABC transporter n=1 Tax=Thermobispora bispora (strain ATCC 19993 / DSM 43833 / CBS 139.67 / JCM 10125 / KCTC 9307 / NBRC 14880 / R51) TaxID=469371 RepID=D6Y4T5_THEBD|nr:GTPase [Thermobispora bispora]ADG89261.1 putative ABC transporter [Thermobispora bispora DSM 43833]
MSVADTTTRYGLGYRLAALAKVVELGQGRLDPALLAEAGRLLARAGDRLQLSPQHTVVALAGGTGSGKSSLFNAVSKLDLSPTGVRRPTTARTHACVWGMDGAGPLLDWLQIQWRHRFARASALDKGEERLHGLILLDLPDHDSIRALTDHEAHRLIQAADLIVWVLDPQKYADASIHQRYVTELAGHDAVTVFVLNQCDRLSPEEQAECLADLRDLLKREGLANPRVIATSAVTGQGIAELTDVLAEAVASRRAAYERLEADLDQLTPRLAKELSGARPVEPEVDAARRGALTDALCDAVGVSAIGETMENLYGVRSIEWVGWPYARWAAKLRPDPVSSLRLGNLREELRSLVGSSVGAQPAEVERAVENLTEAVTDGMPDAWRAGVREVARSRSAELPEALSRELSSLTPPLDRVPRWWWLLKVWQYALVAVFVAGLGLIGAILAYGVFEVARPPSPFFSDVSLLPWLGLIVVCVLGLGLLSAVASKNFVVLEAGKERERMEREMRRRVADLAQRMVIEPVEQELRRYNEFFEAFGSVRR